MCGRCRCSWFSWWRRGRSRLVAVLGDGVGDAATEEARARAELEEGMLQGGAFEEATIPQGGLSGFAARREVSPLTARTQQAPEAGGGAAGVPVPSPLPGGHAASRTAGQRAPRQRPSRRGHGSGEAAVAAAGAVAFSVVAERDDLLQWQLQHPMPWPGDAAGQDAAAAVPPEYVELPGVPRSYNSVEAAMLMSLLGHEKWNYTYVRDEDNGEGDAECRVCLCDYEPGEEIVRLPCMHYAHLQCMEAWLIRSPRCPICRTGVREVLRMGQDVS